MKTPYEILGISKDCNDETVKQGYLLMVKQFSPERFPEDFQRIRHAYEKIKTKKDRAALELFDKTLPEPEELIRELSKVSTKNRPDEQTLQELLALGVRQI
ncbi:J domain-containing protein [Candidatus Electrothrix sp.]|uniref:J domain-containing protein n=1 Tax=Candidatus Electrothrix sp. TaxID=2170559 RepID=UPI004055B909